MVDDIEYKKRLLIKRFSEYVLTEKDITEGLEKVGKVALNIKDNSIPFERIQWKYKDKKFELSYFSYGMRDEKGKMLGKSLEYDTRFGGAEDILEKYTPLLNEIKSNVFDTLFATPIKLVSDIKYNKGRFLEDNHTYFDVNNNIEVKDKGNIFIDEILIPIIKKILNEHGFQLVKSIYITSHGGSYGFDEHAHLYGIREKFVDVYLRDMDPTITSIKVYDKSIPLREMRCVKMEREGDKAFNDDIRAETLLILRERKGAYISLDELSDKIVIYPQWLKQILRPLVKRGKIQQKIINNTIYYSTGRNTEKWLFNYKKRKGYEISGVMDTFKSLGVELTPEELHYITGAPMGILYSYSKHQKLKKE